jgi:hypothetical protein
MFNGRSILRDNERIHSLKKTQTVPTKSRAISGTPNLPRLENELANLAGCLELPFRSLKNWTLCRIRNERKLNTNLLSCDPELSGEKLYEMVSIIKLLGRNSFILIDCG